jgi:hypothetical protein
MAIVKVLARGFDFDINTGSIASPSWTPIGGINQWSHSPAANDADTTDFDDNGRMAHMKASRGDEFTLTGLYLEDDAVANTRNAGQLATEVVANAVGPASIAQFRITSPAGNVRTFLASATVTTGGGGNDDPNSWEVTLKVTASITNSALPAVPAAPTSVTGVGGTLLVTVNWTAPGSGSPFTEYESVAFLAGVEHSRHRATSKPLVHSGLSAATSYTFQVRARNAGGWGPLSAASSGVTTS